MIETFNDIEPKIDSTVYVHSTSVIMGKVTLEKDVSIWPGATLRGDVEDITVGKGSNVQELSSLHTDIGIPLNIGSGVTIGHKAICHSCIIEDNVIIGMGSIILNGAKINSLSIVGAGSIVTKSIEPYSISAGNPAKLIQKRKHT